MYAQKFFMLENFPYQATYDMWLDVSNLYGWSRHVWTLYGEVASCFDDRNTSNGLEVSNFWNHTMKLCWTLA